MTDTDPALMAAIAELRAELGELKAALTRAPVPTVAEFIPKALETCSTESRSVYAPALAWLSDALIGVDATGAKVGELSLDAVSGQILDVLVQRRLDEALLNQRARHGRCAAEHLVGALRLLFRQAVRAGHLTTSPAADLHRPRRPRSTRRDLDVAELAELFTVAIRTSDDPELDELILWTVRETAARREGLLDLRLGDLDVRRGAIHVREKNRDERDLPASQALLERLIAHGRDRGASGPESHVLRYRDGHALTRRRIERLFARVHQKLAWAAQLGVSLHMIRHTTLTDVERVAGVRVARKYAGHAPQEVTDQYTHVSFQELAEAHRLIFGGLSNDSRD